MSSSLHSTFPASPLGHTAPPPTRCTDAALLYEVSRGHPGAIAGFFDRHNKLVNGLVWRLLGADAEHDDLVHEVFTTALRKIHQLRDPAALPAWLTTITVNTVRRELRKRRVRRRFFSGHKSHTMSEQSYHDDHEGRRQLRGVFQALDRMRVNERIAFTLRYVDGQNIEQVARSCGCSLATIKRRLKRAERCFVLLAQRDPQLAERLQRGGRWISD